MARRVPIGLSQEARLELEGFYRRARDGVVKMRCLAIRWLEEGEKCGEVAQKLGVSRITIWRSSQRYLLDGLQGLYNRSKKGRPPKLLTEYKEMLVKAVEREPRELAISATNWTTGLLAYYLARETAASYIKIKSYPN